MNYWIRQGEDVQGPFEAEQVQAWLRAGRLADDMLVSTDQVHWRLVADAVELHAMPAEPAPAKPVRVARPRRPTVRPAGRAPGADRTWLIAGGMVLVGVIAVVLILSGSKKTPEASPETASLEPTPADRPPAPASPPAEVAPVPAPATPAPAVKPKEKEDKRSPDSKRADEAVDDALHWLAVHQSPAGGWEARAFGQWCKGAPIPNNGKRPTGTGNATFDVGVTGLALTAFLGAGYTNRGKHPFARVVSRGLRYLKNVQDAEGCFGSRSQPRFVYNHAQAAVAMVEAYGMTGSPIFKGSAQRSLDFIALCRNPYFAWGYGVKSGENDTSVTAWMSHAVFSARLINADARKRGKPEPLTIDENCFDGMQAWLARVTDPQGRVGYRHKDPRFDARTRVEHRYRSLHPETLTAAGTVVRIFGGVDFRKDVTCLAGFGRIAQGLTQVARPPKPVDMAFLYWGSLAAFQRGGELWTRCQRVLNTNVVPRQRTDTDACRYKGSWDPTGPWGRVGGRVYSTAMMCLCLEVVYRYDRK